MKMRKISVVSDNDTGAGEHDTITLWDKGKQVKSQNCGGDMDKVECQHCRSVMRTRIKTSIESVTTLLQGKSCESEK